MPSSEEQDTHKTDCHLPILAHRETAPPDSVQRHIRDMQAGRREEEILEETRRGASLTLTTGQCLHQQSQHWKVEGGGSRVQAYPLFKVSLNYMRPFFKNTKEHKTKANKQTKKSTVAGEMAQWLNVNTAPAKDLHLVPRPTSGGPQLQVLWPPYSKHLHSRVHAPLIMIQQVAYLLIHIQIHIIKIIKTIF